MTRHSSAAGVLIVGEVAQAHDGDPDAASEYIYAIAKAGASAVKFQAHLADAESTPADEWRVTLETADRSRFDYWKRMEFSEAIWRDLAAHARNLGLQFIVSPFSIDALELLEGVGVDAWKVASGEITNTPLLTRLAATGLPVYLSTGMSTWEEIDQAVKVLGDHTSLCVMQCTSDYPTRPERVGLNMIPALLERYSLRVGISDHSGTIWPGLAAVALGASAVEVHIALDRSQPGPDVTSSITPEELRVLVQGTDFISRAKAHPVDKDTASLDLKEMRALFMKSVVAARRLTKGTVLGESDLALKKPGKGLPPQAVKALVGSELLRDLNENDFVTFADVKGRDDE